MTDKRKQQLLLVLALLLFAKFILQPLLQWQSEKRDQIQLAEKRLTRGEQAIAESQDYQQRIEKLDETLSALKGKLFSPMEETAFRLEQQSWLENKLAQFNLEADSVSWSPIKELSNGVTQHRMDITVIGDVDDVVRFHRSLEQNAEKWVHFLAFNWVINRHLEFRVGTVRGSATVAFYMAASEEGS